MTKLSFRPWLICKSKECGKVHSTPFTVVYYCWAASPAVVDQ
jgi:hypothetical protein